MGTRVCKDFLKGSCRWGFRCKFSHNAIPKDSAENNARVALRAMTDERVKRIALSGNESVAEASASAASDDKTSGASATGSSSQVGDDAAGDIAEMQSPAADTPAAGAGPSGADDEDSSEALPVLSASRITPFSMVQRYYTQMFAPDVCGRRGEDHYVYLQSNRCTILGLAPSHPVVRGGVPAASVQFTDALRALSVSGKKKRGNIFLEPNQIVATVTLVDGRSYTIRACIRAAVMEINTRLQDEPWLLSDPATAATEGHIAILECKLHRVIELQKSLLTEALYTKLCGLRGLPATPVEAQEWAAKRPPRSAPVVQPGAAAQPPAEGAAVGSEQAAESTSVAEASTSTASSQ